MHIMKYSSHPNIFLSQCSCFFLSAQIRILLGSSFNIGVFFSSMQDQSKLSQVGSQQSLEETSNSADA
jgi:hypothetical protein